jgi:predicted kinase
MIEQNTIILVRGLPGSGKSTLASLISNEYPVISADHFFEHPETGDYVFNEALLPEAHSYSQNQVRNLMQNNVKLIYVANTFVEVKEMNKYFILAKEYNYKIFSIIVENRHGNKSVHNVPKSITNTMFNKFDISLTPNSSSIEFSLKHIYNYLKSRFNIFRKD